MLPLPRHRNNINYKVPKQPVDGQWTKEMDAKRKAEQAKIDVATPLTEEENQEKEELMSQGFASWNKRDFQQFVKSCERWGRDNMDQISQEVDSKTPEEVRQYAEVFWEQGADNLASWTNVIEQIERGEQKIQRRMEIRK